MACRRVFKMFERVVKEFMSESASLQSYTSFMYLLDSHQEQDTAGQSPEKDSSDGFKNRPTPQKS